MRKRGWEIERNTIMEVHAYKEVRRGPGVRGEGGGEVAHLLIHNQVQPISSCWIHVVLERHWPELSVDHVAGLGGREGGRWKVSEEGGRKKGKEVESE